MTVTVTDLGTPRLTLGFDRFERLDLNRHRAMHGKLPDPWLGDLIAMAEQVDLRGRGGAAFPFGRKLAAVNTDSDLGTAVLINAAEGEPGSAKDKVLLTRAPHLVLDGAVVVARALRAVEIVIGVVGDTPAERSVRAAVAEREHELPAPVRVVPLQERFIAGQGSALVNAANGQLPIPPGRKVRTSEVGVDGRPTLLSNAETFAQLAVLVSLGPDLYASVGTAREPGTVLLTVGGDTVVEVASGTSLATVLERCGTDPGQGVLVGGYHGAWLTAQAAEHATVCRAGMTAAGGVLGAGIVLPIPAGTCPLGETARIAAYLAAESAGQCGPCRLGLPDVTRTLEALIEGAGGVAAVRRAVGVGRGRGACSHPDGTARFVLSAIEAFAKDIETHRDHGSCGRPTLGVLPLPPEEDAGGRLSIDWARCDGHGVCAYVLPELIRLDKHGYPIVLNTPVPVWAERDARRAVAMCPALALRLSGPAENR